MRSMQTLFLTLMTTITLNAQVAFNEQVMTYPDVGTFSYGASVSLSGEWLAIGNYNPDDSGSCSVFMYKYDYTTMSWPTIPTQRLEGANGNCNGNKGFGAAISLSGARMVVGLAGYSAGKDKDVGAFYPAIYDTSDLDSANWEWTTLYKNAGPIIADDAQTDSEFGSSLSIQGDKLVVGSPAHDVTLGSTAVLAADVVKIYVYDCTALDTDETPLAVKTGIQSGDRFGQAVTSRDGSIFVGSPGFDSNSHTDNGAGFAYSYDAGVLTRIIEVFGTLNGAEMGVQIAAGLDKILVAGRASFGFIFDGADWTEAVQHTLTKKADVSISEDNSAFGYLDTSVDIFIDMEDSYKVQVTPGTSRPGYAEDISLYKDQLAVSEFNASIVRMYDMPCGYGEKLIENQWKMISVPCHIPGATVNDVFNTGVNVADGDDLGTYTTDGYDGNWAVYEQNTTFGSTTASYILMTENTLVEQGKSYWIICDHNVTTRVDASVSNTRTSFDALASTDVAIPGYYEFPLPDIIANETARKIMVGNPFPRTFKWIDLLEKVGSTRSPVGGVIVDATGYVYDTETPDMTNGQNYRVISSTGTPGFSDEIKPNQGFWIKQNNQTVGYSGLSLSLPFEK